MPKIFPFQAYRFNTTDKKLAAQVCPPYDVIDEKLEQKLKKNANNAIQIELPSGQGDAKYPHAAKVWQEWKDKNVVAQDKEAAFYVYQQIFKVEKKKYVRTGFFCELQVEEPGKGSVLRHELTIAGPKLDRLNLIRALGLNTSPIFGMFPDKKKVAEKTFTKLSKQKPLAKIKDSDGVEHRLWALTDKTQLEVLQKLVAQNPVAIADGHHRNETAWNFSKESKIPGAKNALFFLCAMEEPGLVIFPTHRIVRASQDSPSIDEVVRRAQAHGKLFEVRKEKSHFIPKHKGLVLTNGREHYSISVASESALKKQFGEKPKAYRELSLNYLHQFLFPNLKKEDFQYSHDLKETLTIMRKNKTFAILVPPVSTQELFGIVTAGELMPQKSTYFYPKIITGILFRSL